MTRKLTRTVLNFGIVSTFLALIAIPTAPIALAQATGKTPVPGVSIDFTNRTVTTSNFLLTWNTGADTEAITTLDWMGGSNLTGTLGLDTCGGLRSSGRRRILR